VKRLHGIATADDLVHRKFHRLSPNELWITDITEHPTREGKIYCCAVMDTFSRKIVGWSIDKAQDSTLVVNALDMAIKNRQPPASGIVHADHGVQFTSWAFTNKIRSSGLMPSFGTIGDCYENAIDENRSGPGRKSSFSIERNGGPGWILPTRSSTTSRSSTTVSDVTLS